jgi:hypothetical protein
MFPDWQAYDDGSLTSEERAQTDMILETDRQARAELDAFRAFRAAVRKAGQSEPVPSATLEAMLKNVVQTPKPVKRTLFLPLGLAVAAALILGVTFGPRLLDIAQPKSPEVKIMASSDPKQVQTWLVSNTHGPAPLITGKGCGAKVVDGKFGPGWMAWDVEMKGQKYTIIGKKRDEWHLGQVAETSYQGSDFMLNGDDVGWQCELDMVYFVSGGTCQGRLEVAKAARQETPSIIRV